MLFIERETRKTGNTRSRRGARFNQSTFWYGSGFFKESLSLQSCSKLPFQHYCFWKQFCRHVQSNGEILWWSWLKVDSHFEAEKRNKEHSRARRHVQGLVLFHRGDKDSQPPKGNQFQDPLCWKGDCWRGPLTGWKFYHFRHWWKSDPTSLVYGWYGPLYESFR